MEWNLHFSNDQACIIFAMQKRGTLFLEICFQSIPKVQLNWPPWTPWTTRWTLVNYYLFLTDGMVFAQSADSFALLGWSNQTIRGESLTDSDDLDGLVKLDDSGGWINLSEGKYWGYEHQPQSSLLLVGQYLYQDSTLSSIFSAIKMQALHLAIFPSNCVSWWNWRKDWISWLNQLIDKCKWHLRTTNTHDPHDKDVSKFSTRCFIPTVTGRCSPCSN